MKVLWFSLISLSQDKNGDFFYPGGNWIISLIEQLKNEKNIDLGIAYFGSNDSIIQDNYGTKYYQLSKNKVPKLTQLYKNWQHEIDDRKNIDKMLATIKKFKPDLIHIFGTESDFGNIIKKTSVPVVFHLQGLINPYLNTWKFPGYNTYYLLRSLNPIFWLKGHGLFHDYFRFRKMAKRELEIFSNGINFMGRTHWDKAITKLYSPKSNYYHCDEVMRDSFYNVKWEIPISKKIILSSTINPNIYKGLDLIVKTAMILMDNSNLDFEWNIYGVKQDSEYAHFVTNISGGEFITNNINLRGVTLIDDLLEGLLNSHMFIHPSYIDNSPNSVCEAQLVGLPVISTNVGGVSSLINDGVDGFLVPSNEPHLLASKIIDLVQNRDRLQFVSSNAIEIAKKRHDRSQIKSDLLRIYSKILNENN